MEKIKPVYGRKPIEKLVDKRKLVKYEETKVKPIKVPATRDVIIEAEDESGTTINDIKTVLTENDITGLTPRPNINTPVTTATISYVVKKIPVPSTNNINVLSASSKIWNIPRLFLEDENQKYSYITNEDNIVREIGGQTQVKVLGDDGAAFKLVVKDVTNSKWYNWDAEEFQSGYNDLESKVDSKSLLLNFPSQEVETTYNTFFTNIGSTTYDEYLPTEDNPWVTNQLVNPTVTIKFRDIDGYNSGKTTTKKHFPGAVLNSGSIDNAKIPINITAIPLRGSISIKNSTVKAENITTVDSATVVANSDLTASVSDKVGVITGTITIGESSKRDADILFNPDDFFTIT